MLIRGIRINYGQLYLSLFNISKNLKACKFWKNMEGLKKNHKKFIRLKQAKKIIIALVFVLFFDFFLFPAPALASQMVVAYGVDQAQDQLASLPGQAELSIVEFNGKLPENQDLAVKWARQIVVTAYNSEVGQTDSTPCLTAANFNVCANDTQDTIAANFLPFGAKVKIPELFGHKVFIVRDRMNRRFSHRIDVWMVEKPDAINFGVQLAKIEVLE
jgi:3D (Asp-Asp-Asp) domain-containing protein